MIYLQFFFFNISSTYFENFLDKKVSVISINVGLGLMSINLLEYYINVNHNSILKFSVYPKNKKVKEGIGWWV